jgi:phosphoribosylglycinamide formyltransferase-1
MSWLLGDREMSDFRLGVLASGRGSNLQSIMDACAARQLEAEVVLVISDQVPAYALERARAAGIPAVYINPGNYQSRQDYDAAVVEILLAHGVELVCLAGYMRLVGKVMLAAYPNKIINIHPALLPAFPASTVSSTAAVQFTLWMKAWIQARLFCRRRFRCRTGMMRTACRPEF